MVTIIPIFKEGCAFDPKAVTAMGMAFDDVCRILEVPADAASLREALATRIIEVAKRGERSPTVLRDRVLFEARGTLDDKRTIAL
jgi:ABC-type hemin transport system substrate-binding protein